MPSTARRAVLALVAGAALFSLTGCGLIDVYFMKPPEDTARELYDLGAEAFKERRYGDSAELFRKLVDRYPFSPYTESAQLGLADALYMDEKYALSVEAYKEFESLHPRHERIPYVVFQLGMAHFNQYQSLDRPQEPLTTAMQYFNRVRETWPETEYAAESEKLLTQCRRKLAEHELWVGDFYFRQKRYQSAYVRYQHVAEAYGEFPELAEYGKSQANDAYFLYQRESAESERQIKEKSWRRWFDWL